MKLSRIAYTLLSIMVLTTTVIACGAPVSPPSVPEAITPAAPPSVNPATPPASPVTPSPAPAAPEAPPATPPAAAPATTNYPNADLLVSVKWLNENLNDPNLIILDGRAASAYDAGHIKGAINLPVAVFNEATSTVPTDITQLMNANTLANMLGPLWVSDKSKVVVYGANVDYFGARLFWMLEYLGHKDVHVLDGGYDKWKAQNNPVVTEKPMKNPALFTAKPNDKVIATKPYVLSSYKDSNFVLVDSRNATDYIVKRIPGAVNLLMGDYLNADGTVKSFNDLTALLSSKGIVPGKTIISYCYVGYRSAQAYFIYRLMGYDVSNYDGSSTEWLADSSLPTEP